MSTFKRYLLAASPEAIAAWRARLFDARGRLNPFRVPDGLAPVLRLTHRAEPEAGFLRVTGEHLSAFWHRPAACLILESDGMRQHVLTATCHDDRGGVIVLRSGLARAAPAGSRVIRLVRARLDHDSIDFYWQTPTQLTATLTVRQLPEPRGQDNIVAAPPPLPR
jgi:hypothetical protein